MAEVDAFDFVAEVTDFLRVSRTASLSTVNEHGRPHAANIQYACVDLETIYFVSSPKSAHSQHLAINPSIAMTVYAHVDLPDQIHGVQLHGRCKPIDNDVEFESAWHAYTDTFPFVLTNPMIEQRLRSEQFYCICPTWMRYIDNRRGFGFKVEQVFEL